MRPTFLGFEAGRKGLAVAQKGLDITGHNLMNAATPGYTRQRIDQVSVSTYGMSTRMANNYISMTGQGVNITGVAQIRDPILDRRFREEFADSQYYQTKSDIFSDLATVVDEYANQTNGTGLLEGINGITDAIKNISGDKATDRACANALLTSFKSVCQTLNDFSTKLDKIAAQQKEDLAISVDDVNSILAKIAGLNEQIAAEIGLNPTDERIYEPNELLDERNLLIDELSKYGNVEITSEADGTVTVSLGGHVAVSGNDYDMINHFERPGGTYYLEWLSSGKEAVMSTGSLKAAVDMINGRGPDMQSQYETPEKGVLYYKDRLNAFANTLANAMNTVLPGQIDEQGNPVDGSGYKKVLQSSDGQGITAGNITVSDEWLADVAYIFPNPDSLNNSTYFQKMGTLLNKDGEVTFNSLGTTFTGSFEEYIMDMHNTCAGEASFTSGRLEATAAVADQLLNQRDAVAGVSQDEETTNMLTYQKSFQAVSRLMTAMDDCLDVIINKMGRVGL